MERDAILLRMRQLKAKTENKLEKLKDRVDGIDEILISHGNQLNKLNYELGISKGKQKT
jgi:methyl coenzyme M reductase subunit D